MKNRHILIYTLLLILLTISTQKLRAQPDCAGQNGKLRFFYWNNITGSNMNNLLNHPNYPTTPDGMIYLNELKTPDRFNDYYGGRIRGFISPSETGDYTFNIIGNHNVKVYLSTDETPSQLDSICATFTHLDIGHDQFASQTSADIFLETGNYYFFEILLKESNGADHIRLYWKTPSQQEEWRIIEGAYVYDYICDTICQPYGTPCDDNDPETVNDIEDGHCNCYGQPPIGTSCIGERGHLVGLFYADIEGGVIADLEADDSYPNVPTHGMLLNRFYADFNDLGAGIGYGSLVKAFIRPPESGDYTFRVYGDNETKIYLSSGEAPEDISLLGETTFGYGTPQTVTLVGGEYYYIELRHKANGNGDIFWLQWQIPNSTEFETIDADFFYAYNDCDDICIPDGVLCNDYNDATYLDQYENCNCVGTPCDVPDCSNGVNYVPYDICNTSDYHVNNELDSWLSCSVEANPNDARPDGHWVLFDLYETHKIHNTHIWNYNVAGQTGKGFKDVLIDYSIDGNNWLELTSDTWAQAPGTTGYTGFVGPEFGGVAARYVLISGTSNWNNDNCSGFSEWKMFVEACPELGTACDDGNPNNFNDQYNEVCECMGFDEPLALNLIDFKAAWQNNDALVHWTVQQEAAGTYYEVHRSLDGQQFESIALVQGKALSKEKINYQMLDTKGSERSTDLYYRLKIIEASGEAANSHIVHLSRTHTAAKMVINSIQPNPFEVNTTIECSLPSEARIQLLVFDTQGRLVRQLANEKVAAGTYQTPWDGKNEQGKVVETGLYYVQLSNGQHRVARKVLKH